MARRLWTVVIVSDDDSPVRQFRLTREAARICIALTLFAVAGFSSVATAVLLDDRPVQLQAKTELLEEELGDLNERIDTLATSLNQLAQKDEFYRLLAGLEPTNSDVLKAGIGGPDADKPTSLPLYRVSPRLARRTFDTSSELSSLLRRVRVLASSWRQAEDTLTARQARLEATPNIYPAEGYVSSSFSTARWHPILAKPRPHNGIDIVARFGSPVVASGRGRIEAVGHHNEYGLTVDIDHGSGLVTRYAHLSRTIVKVGQVVARGQQIGAVGMSGLAIGPHVHYEVLVHGEATNPRRFIRGHDVVPD